MQVRGGEVALGNNLPGEHGTFRPQILGPIESARYAQYQKMRREATVKGWNAATVINLLPLELNPPSVLLHGLKIRAVPVEPERWALSNKVALRGGLEIPYVSHVILDPEFLVLEQVVGTTPQDFSGMVDRETCWPMDLAKDILITSNSGEQRGGVFCYEGTHSPLANPDTKEYEQDLLEEAYEKMIPHLTNYFDFAEEAFAGGNDKLIKQVRPYHKWCTRYLVCAGVLKEEPKWLTRKLTTKTNAKIICSQCGKIQQNDGGAKCDGPGCNYFIDPFRGFKDGMFDLETPGGIMNLRRCSKQQLIELGLYPDVVRPLAEYLKRVGAKARKGGKDKEDES